MIESQLQGLARYECFRIGNDIISQAKQDNNGCYWLSTSIDKDGNQSKIPQYTLYNGGAGIALFLFELYKLSSEPSYLAYAESALNWSVKASQISDYPVNFSFFSGKGGLIYALVRAEEISSDSNYLETAVSLATFAPQFLNYCGDDIIGGAAGTILSLLYLFNRTKSEMFFHYAELFADRLLKRMFIGKEGIYWERSRENIGGLCGYAHGASGVGHAFLELYSCTNKSQYLWVAEQTFRYEDYLFRENGFWPDLRQGRFREEDEKKHFDAFMAKNNKFFTQGINFDRWCHGAAGIGLARLRAFELTRKAEHKEASKRAVESVVAADKELNKYPNNTYTLCHGRFGSAALLSRWNSITSTSDYSDIINQIARAGLDSYQNLHGYISGYFTDMNESSLMMGSAGIGLFFASLLEGIEPLNVLAPSINFISEINITENVNHDPIKYILAKNFTQTIASSPKLLEENTEIIETLYEYPSEEVVDKFQQKISQKKEYQLLNNFLDYDVQKFHLDNQFSSFVFLRSSWEFILKKASEVLDSLSEIELCLNPNIYNHI